jgi:gentisate 1,2-dioxygenase
VLISARLSAVLKADEDTVLSSYSDRAALEKLGLFREQRGHEARREA